MRRTRGLHLLLFVVPLLTNCAGRVGGPDAAANPPPAPNSGSYIDLQPGWRLSVITPMLKAGAHRVAPQKAQAEATGNTGRELTLTVSAAPDFLGYERSYYRVEPRRGGGVKVRFSSAETVQDGKTAAQNRPKLPLFQLPRQARHVRLVYLVRGSGADHNMAIIAAARPEHLDALTRQLQSDPANGCTSQDRGICQWIPAGIAVRPEMQRPSAPGEWTPAR